MSNAFMWCAQYLFKLRIKEFLILSVLSQQYQTMYWHSRYTMILVNWLILWRQSCKSWKILMSSTKRYCQGHVKKHATCTIKHLYKVFFAFSKYASIFLYYQNHPSNIKQCTHLWDTLWYWQIAWFCQDI